MQVSGRVFYNEDDDEDDVDETNDCVIYPTAVAQAIVTFNFKKKDYDKTISIRETIYLSINLYTSNFV